ncbi:unnamed protein product, partial [Didymodactylos carnosus]
ENAIEIEHGLFKWSNDDHNTLTLNKYDMVKVQGNIKISGQTALVPQQAWILNGTFQNNILFGKDMNQQQYDRIIEACALGPDLEMLPHGDQTEIGERGVNLSGGQKQRISLARSIYADADIYLLDDPLSAVDQNVAKHLVQYVLGPTGLLAEKTRILVTHGIVHFQECEMIIIMSNGEIIDCDRYENLVKKDKILQEFILSFNINTYNDSRKRQLVFSIHKFSGFTASGRSPSSLPKITKLDNRFCSAVFHADFASTNHWCDAHGTVERLYRNRS